MSLYTSRQFRLKSSVLQSLDNPVIDRGASEQKISGVAELAEATGSQIVVAAAATDEQLPMGSGIVTGRAFYMEADQDVTIKFGGTEADRALSVKVPSTTYPAILYLDIEFTSVYITNAGTDDANVFYAVIGA